MPTHVSPHNSPGGGASVAALQGGVEPCTAHQNVGSRPKTAAQTLKLPLDSNSTAALQPGPGGQPELYLPPLPLPSSRERGWCSKDQKQSHKQGALACTRAPRMTAALAILLKLVSKGNSGRGQNVRNTCKSGQAGPGPRSFTGAGARGREVKSTGTGRAWRSHRTAYDLGQVFQPFCLSFLTCEMGRTVIPALRVLVRRKWA